MSSASTQPGEQHLVSQWIAALRGPRAISLTATLIIGVASLLPTLNLERHQYSTFAAAILATAIVTAASGAVLLVSDRTVLRHRKTRPAPLATVVTVYLLTGLVRPLASWGFAELVGDPNTSIDTIRALQAVLVSVFSLGVVAIVLDANDRQLAAIRLLSDENEDLRAVRERNKESLAFDHQQVATRIRDEAVANLARLGERLTAVRDRQLTPAILRTCSAEIRQTIDDFVRPLAQRALAPTEIEIPDRSATRAAPTPKWSAVGDLIRDSFLVHPFQPIALPAALFVTYVASLPSKYGTIGWVWAIGDSVVAFLVLKFYQRLLPDSRLRTFSTAKRVVVIAGAIVAMALVVVYCVPLALSVFYGTVSAEGTFIGSAFVVIAFYWAILSFGTAAIKRRQIIETDLKSTRAALQFELMQQQVQLDQLRESLSEYLHGEVQSRLASTALRLDITADALSQSTEQSVAAEAVNDAIATLDQITNEATSLSGKTLEPSFTMAIDEVVRVWSGLIDVFVEIDETVLPAIAESPACAMTVVSLAGESITNAVKHGAAERVDITINLDGDAIVFEAIDDGIGPPTTVEPGIGLSKNLRGALRWELRRGPAGGAELYVALPARM